MNELTAKEVKTTVKKKKEPKNWYMFLWYLIPHVARLIYPCRIIKKAPMPKGAGVMVCNHLAAFDVVYAALTTREVVHFLFKKELAKTRFMQRWTRRAQGIGVDRGNCDLHSVMDSLRYLRKGEKVCVFPEGTRNKKGGDMLPFMSGASMFAIKAKVPVIPIYITQSATAFKRNVIIVGEAFEFTEFYGKKLTGEDYEKADAIMREKLEAIRDEYFASVAKKK